MYKALLVDDEKMIRMGIRRVIQWNSLMIDEVYTAASGQEALELVKEHQPDIMITDIRMTEMTGLDLIEEIRKFREDMRVIVLTGYDNFEYARQCLRMNVQEFLLKPIDEDILTETIRKQIHDLELKKEKDAALSMQQRVEGTAKQLKLETFMRDLIHRRAGDSETIKSRLPEFHLNPETSIQAVIILPAIYLDSGGRQDMFRILSIKNISIGIVDAENKGITFQDDDGKILIVLFNYGCGGGTVEETKQLMDILKDEYGTKPKAVMGTLVDGFDSLYVSYNDALYLLDHEQNTIDEIVVNKRDKSREDLFRDIYAELKKSMLLNLSDGGYVLHVFESFVKASDSYNLSPAYTRRCCFEIASSLYFSCLNTSGNEQEGKLTALARSLLNTSRKESCEVTEMYLKQLLFREEGDANEIIDEVRRYIEEHLGEDLSVTSIAGRFYITANYLSRLFKRVTGEGCNEYIVKKRIEKAKCLLETTSMKAGTIALMVGYRDTNYFSLSFKKYQGISPTKYREDIREKETIK